MPLLNRRDVVNLLLSNRQGMAVVAGLGSPAYDLAASGNEPLEFPTWGAMGGAAMIGLGLALAQPDRTVLVLTGDGEMLMGMGSLATIGVEQPPNLRIVVLDNEEFGETGRQATHTATNTDLAAVARACGIVNSQTITDMEQVSLLHNQIHSVSAPLLAVIKVSAEPVPRVLPPRDGPYLTMRFRTELLGDDAV